MRIFNRRQKNKIKKKARLPLSAYVTYLLIVTMIFTGVSFSKYATTASSESSARVAGFNVSVTEKSEVLAKNEESNNVLELKLEDSLNSSCEFTVTSESEVATEDIVKITLPEQLPQGLKMEMEVNGEEIELSEVVQENETEKNDSVSYACSKLFDFGFDEHKWKLTFVADPEILVLNEDELLFSGIQIHVDVMQANERD